MIAMFTILRLLLPQTVILGTHTIPETKCKTGPRNGVDIPAHIYQKCPNISQRYRNVLMEVAEELELLFIDWHELLYAEKKGGGSCDHRGTSQIGKFMRDFTHPNKARSAMFGRLLMRIASEYSYNLRQNCKF